jgi:bifunctional UDP-N-acetylglucosamine pyrophosphorylase/glucosamine-1-phosphate N-acetyltransferase
MAVPARLLKTWLARLDNNNAQGEYYLTDIVKFAVADGVPVVAHKITDAVQVAGVNSPVQLAELERAFQLRHGQRADGAGRAPGRPGPLRCARRFAVRAGRVDRRELRVRRQGVWATMRRIGANCVIANATIAAGAVIHPFTHIDGEQARRARTRRRAGADWPVCAAAPRCRAGAEVHIGNFVEVKNSTLARGAKANHLAYLGDATVGERVNYGAGSITANYDGAFKHRTVIEADVHMGSNCVLVAPVTIGAGGTMGGGSTITKDAARFPDVARGRRSN